VPFPAAQLPRSKQIGQPRYQAMIASGV